MNLFIEEAKRIFKSEIETSDLSGKTFPELLTLCKLARNDMKNSDANELKSNSKEVNFTLPTIEYMTPPQIFNFKDRLTIPQRLDQPLFKMDPEVSICILKYIRTRERRVIKGLSMPKMIDYVSIYNAIDKINPSKNIKIISGPLRIIRMIDDMLIHVSSEPYVANCMEVAKEIAKQEIKIATETMSSDSFEGNWPGINQTAELEKMANLLIMMHVIRVKSVVEYSMLMKHDGSFERYGGKDHINIEIVDGTYIINLKLSEKHYTLLINDTFFISIYDNVLCVNYSNHYNYMITLLEMKFNANLICSSNEYEDMRDYVHVLSELPKLVSRYDQITDIMISIESLSLYLMDLLGKKKPSLMCIIDVLDNLISSISEVESNNSTAEDLLYNILHPNLLSKTTWLNRLLKSMTNVKCEHLGDLSSSHKYLSYAEIIYHKGWKKYHDRTADRFNTNQVTMKRIILLARREFTRGYIKRQKRVPKMLLNKENESSINEFRSRIETQGISAFTKYEDLSNWEKLIPYDCLSSKAYSDPVMNLRDKACTVDNYESGKKNSVKEIIHYLNHDLTAIPDLSDILSKAKPKKTRQYQIFQNNDVPCNEYIKNKLKTPRKLVTRLVPKEKEQKPEGRFFGVASFDVKLALSKMMVDVKSALGYFRDQVMTLSDMERKIRFHEAAQTLREDSVYSLMIDISGHNQSMTESNCKDLLEFVMNLFGKTGYGDLYRIFRDQTVVQEYDELGIKYVSSGQSGGIEGWMNHLWGLQSALIMRLYVEDRGIDTIDILTYSDDIQLIFRSYEGMSPDYVFLGAQDAYRDMGQLTKLKQTQLSGTRLTMLKNHYWKGLLLPTTFKRLLSMSIFSSKHYYSDTAEFESINSTVTSALDNANDLYTILYMKHIYLFIVGYKRFTEKIMSFNNPEIIKHLPAKLQSYVDAINTPSDDIDILNFNFGKSYIVFLNDKRVTIRVSENGVEYGINTKRGNYEMKYLNQSDEIYDELSYAIRLYATKANVKSDMINQMSVLFKSKDENNTYLLLWILYLHTPIAQGGAGMLYLEQQVISGHSDSKSKWLENSMKLLQIYSIDDNERRWFLQFILKSYNHLNYKPNLNTLIAHRYPPHKSAMTYHDIIKDVILKYLDPSKKRIKSSTIYEYMRQYEYRDDVIRYIIGAFSRNYSYRIARKYLDESHVQMINTFLSKVDNSATIISLERHPSEIKKLVFQIFRSTNVIINYFFETNTILDKAFIDMNATPELILERLRREAYKSQIKFNDICEPTYDKALILSRSSAGITVTLQNKMTCTSAGSTYTTPMYNKHVRPKYQTRLEIENYMANPVENRIFELARFTKWLIASSLKNTTRIIDEYKNNAVQVCNYLLSFYTRHRYEELSKFVYTPSGGEIFHRTDNQGFKSASALRVFPSDSGRCTVVTDNTFIMATGSVDSNVNYDYLRCKLTLKHLLREKYGSTKYSIRNLYYDLDDRVTHTMQNVQLCFIEPSNDIIFPIINKCVIDLNQLGQKIEIITDLLKEGKLKPEEIDIKIGRALDKVPNMGTFDTKFFANIELLSKVFESPNVCSTDDLPDDHLLQLLTEFDKTEFEQNFGEDTYNIDSFRKIIDDRLARKVKNRFIYMGDVNKAIRDTIILSNLDLMNCLLNSIGNGKYTKSLSHRLKFVHDYMFFLIINDYLIFDSQKTENEGEYVITINKKVIKRILNDILLETAQYEVDFIKDDYHIKSWSGLQYVSNNVELRRIFAFIRPSLMKQVLDRVVNQIGEMYRNIPFKGIRVDPNQVDSTHITIKSKPLTINRLFQYSKTKIASDMFKNLDMIHKAVHWYENLVMNHASMPSFNSSTGSQSYIAQKSLFAKLLQDEYIKDNDYIADLCAGRGDGHHALNDLGINHVSVTRADSYDIYNCEPNIVQDKKLNIYDISTFTKYLKATVIHIDLTFNKIDDIGNIFPVIINLVNMNKKVIIRMNWLSGNLSEQLINDLKKFEINLYSPIAEKYTGYQFYLTFQLKNSEQYEVNDTKSIATQIRHSALRLKSYDPFDIDEDIPVDTSASYMITDANIMKFKNEHINADMNNITNNLNLYSTAEIYRSLVSVNLKLYPENNDKILCIVCSKKILSEMSLDEVTIEPNKSVHLAINDYDINRNKKVIELKSLGKMSDINQILENLSRLKIKLEYRNLIYDIKIIVTHFLPKKNVLSHNMINELINNAESDTFRLINDGNQTDMMNRAVIRSLIFRMIYDCHPIKLIYKRLRKIMQHTNMEFFDFRSICNKFMYYKKHKSDPFEFKWSTLEFDQYIIQYENTLFGKGNSIPSKSLIEEEIKVENLIENDENYELIANNSLLSAFLSVSVGFVKHGHAKKMITISDEKVQQSSKQINQEVRTSDIDNKISKGIVNDASALLMRSDENMIKALKTMTDNEYLDDIGEIEDYGDDDDFLSEDENDME